MTKKLAKLLIVSMCMTLLTSCWDSKDINKKSIALSIGVDYVNDNIEFTGEIAKLTSSDEEKVKTSDVYKMLSYGKTFEECRKNYDSVNPFSVFLGATRIVVFGENYAKRGIEPYLNRIDHLYDYRKTILTVVTREKPRELFNVKVDKDICVGFLIEDIMEHVAGKGEGLYPVTGELLSDIKLGKIGYLLPYVGIEKGSIKYLGLAAMKNSKLVGIINIKDTDGIMYVLAEKPRIVQIIDRGDNGKNKISFRTIVNKREIKADYVHNKVKINIDLELKAQLRYQYYMKPISDEYTKKLENIISEKVKNNIESVIKRSQKEFECDIFGFARYFRAKKPEIYKKINWEDGFREADVEVNVKTKITNKTLTDPNAKEKY
ncbi:MAG: Ger(x)C family spore germination protein [Anaeromicrobium sp.]|jgi:spore germination protein KC|uniref:Ger(x)C family spore germination protein n=1 Tax=Anaeromicrobium sp. TaxID=1929132 RepID=UPI0025F864D2|nr:Ger(x)C family spore germination protein [Anaeromicrobium sp.]MCT4595966.1 Ger(x)C family spore germination protein [Anaeromicrobium sp.]